MFKIIGRKPVLEAINSNIKISEIYVRYGSKHGHINAIITAAKKRGIKISQLSTSKFDSLAAGKETQGVIALKEKHKLYDFSKLLNEIEEVENPVLLLLDGIQDPHNLGAILRTAECSGVDGVIITTHKSASITDTVEKTSAGAVSHLKISTIHNLNHIIDDLKREGFWIFGSYLNKSSVDYTSVDYNTKVAIVVGNEHKGIHKLIADKCDHLVEIPMKGKIQSLNVSVATGVLLFEVQRQRAK